MRSDFIDYPISSSQSVEDLKSTLETENEKNPSRMETSNQIGFMQYSLQANDHSIRSAFCLSKPLRINANAKPQQTFKHRLKAVYRVALEFAFQMANYPSRADKMLLATVCGMTYKQINNWFQNRRDRPEMAFEYNVPTTVAALRDVLYDLLDQSIVRSRVDGKKSHPVVKSLEAALNNKQNTGRPDEPPISPIVEVHQHDSPVMGSQKETDTRVTENIPQKNDIATTHIEDLFTFPKPEWRRRPAGLPHQQSHSSPNVDQVVSKLNSIELQSISTAGNPTAISLASVAVVNRPMKKLPLRTGRSKPVYSAVESQIVNLSNHGATSFTTAVGSQETSHSLVTRNIRPLPQRYRNSRVGEGTLTPA